MEPTAVNLYDEPSNLIVDGLSQSDVVVGLTRTVPSSGGGWSWSYLRYINYYLQNSHRCEDATPANATMVLLISGALTFTLKS